jgi:hypothetical protein
MTAADMDVQPMPGEACTELGADQDVRPGMQMLVWALVLAGAAICAGLLLAA